MNLKEHIQTINAVSDLTPSEIKDFWQKSLSGNPYSFNQLKYYYMKLLLRIKPLYTHLDEEIFYSILEQSVQKALERGLKFQVDDYDSYMTISSQIYFKYNLLPKTDSIHIPAQLLRAFLKLEELYQQLPSLQQKDEQTQIKLISIGFEYPMFSTRLLFYSYKKWKNKTLRQIDIDLSTALLPAPQRIEWEIFYEKSLSDIKEAILQTMVS
ncbi:hypothetical protein BHF71_09645 [Vulcanibacillus modesticaldus]|uniref:Uncharacterized protein n=1 Tax=Vulcanibacillus modesticaldus TaxID=337097 RepID=A0A1D2YU17_9BACI|nr:hypothetical protein [Vulcanibacillus modesticaldus]OEF99202.1 hypothetical protein BHF71_09645 [Vulcanibacillus modesticaldus]